MLLQKKLDYNLRESEREQKSSLFFVTKSDLKLIIYMVKHDCFLIVTFSCYKMVY